MPIIDSLASVAAAPDITIIGSGPVGLAVALGCAKSGRSVCVIESGGRNIERSAERLSRAEIVDARRHDSMEIAVRRGLGGTSRLWGGRIVPLDEIDFDCRYAEEGAEWPIKHSDLLAEYASAAEFFGLANGDFESPVPGFTLPSGACIADLELWCPETDMARLHLAKLNAPNGPRVLLGATVIGLEFDDKSRRVNRIVIATADGRHAIPVKTLVLAGGGLESTRLLLSEQRRHPHLFGGIGGSLGRYYMGHISGKIASLSLTRPRDVEFLDFFLKPRGGYARRRFTFERQVLKESGIQNVALWIDNPPFYQAAHRSGALSLVYLALAIGPIGRRLVSEAVRTSHVGRAPGNLLKHIGNIFSVPIRTAGDIFHVLRDRYISKPKRPGFIIRNDAGRYALHYHAEQRPNADSRVTLADSTDELGVPRLKIDLRYRPDDAVSVLKAHVLLNTALTESGHGSLEYWQPEAERIDHVMSQASDGIHQIGTTRMSASPQTGVVDEHCRVHGIDNLYVASSSVFPTSGQANPTFAAVALALRLARRLSILRDT